MMTCHFCTQAAFAGQFIDEHPCCWDCKKAEGMAGWVVLAVERSMASGGVYLHGVNLDTADRLFRHFVWDLSTSINDSRYDFSKAKVTSDARPILERLRSN